MRAKVMKVICIFSLVCVLSACASGSRYISAPTEQPSELGIISNDSNLSIGINCLIAPNGPGAWIKDARWDEYVLTVRNISDKPLTVERIRLVDPRGLFIDSGVDPYQLEAMSGALAEQYKNYGITVAAEMAGGAAIAGAAGAGAAIAATTGFMFAPVAILAVPAYFAVKGNQNKMEDMESIRKEFARRRLLNFTIAGNSTLPGSVFFPIIPSPKTLVVDYRIGDEMKALEISLEKLTGLHIATAKEEKKYEGRQ